MILQRCRLWFSGSLMEPGNLKFPTSSKVLPKSPVQGLQVVREWPLGLDMTGFKSCLCCFLAGKQQVILLVWASVLWHWECGTEFSPLRVDVRMWWDCFCQWAHMHYPTLILLQFSHVTFFPFFLWSSLHPGQWYLPISISIRLLTED